MKYMGSKGRIAKHILPIILKDRKPDQWYVEPFVGGANIIDKVDGNRIGSDVNRYLIALLIAMQNGYCPPYLSREQVSLIKENKHLYSDELVGWAGIGCSYSGKWFGGYAGCIITKDGGERDYIFEAIKNCLNQGKLLNGVIFLNKSYESIDIPDGSIIYCDPPYKGTEGYRVKFNHEDFYDWCDIMHKYGHKVFLSEYQAPKQFKCIWQKELTSSLSANGKSGGSKSSIEKLFIYDPK